MSIFDALKKGKDIFVDAREALKENVWDKISPVDSAEEIQQQRQQSMLPSVVKDIQTKQAMEQGMIPLGDRYVDPLFSGGLKKIVGSTVKNVVAPAVVKSGVFTGFDDLSTHVLEKLKGVGDTSEKFIIDTMQNVKGKLGLKQPEQNIYINALFDTVKEGKVNASEFANRVKQDLLPLTTKTQGSIKLGGKVPARYEGVTLSEQDGSRGPVTHYAEHIYESPVKTSAGSVHFSYRGYSSRNNFSSVADDSADNYFGHTRIEDMADNSTRRVIELQSDLFQKGRLDNERTILPDYAKARMTPEEIAKSDAMEAPRNAELDKLEPYRNIWHERLIREEVKQAAVDGKTKLQFPTGETAMKIEGLGQSNTWSFYPENSDILTDMTPNNLKVGLEINEDATTNKWIVTDVLGDGKFKAVQKQHVFEGYVPKNEEAFFTELGENKHYRTQSVETFDISGKADTSNPIYKFYESEVGKYLQKKYNAKMKIDDNGVTWWEVDVDPSVANQPVKAFGGLAIPAGVKSLFEDQQQSQTNPDGSTSSMSIPSPIKSLFGAKMEYNRTDAPTKQEQVPTPAVTAPKVIDTVTDIHGPYDVLETGTTVRPVREKLKSAIEQAYASAPTIDKGVVEAILMKESSMGTNPANRNPDIGKYAWLVGFTKIAKAELIRHNIVPDLDTPEGAIRALAQYWDLRDDKYATSTEAYNQHYSSGKLKPEQLQEFDDMVKYYQANG